MAGDAHSGRIAQQWSAGNPAARGFPGFSPLIIRALCRRPCSALRGSQVARLLMFLLVQRGAGAGSQPQRRPARTQSRRSILWQRTMPPVAVQSDHENPLGVLSVVLDVDDHWRFVTLTQKALQAFLYAGPRDAIPAIDHLLRCSQATGW